jgi:hypothetical protein
MRLHWPFRIASSIAAVVCLCGCPNPNTYTTPRTLNQGALQFQVAAEAWGASFNQPVLNSNGVGSHTETATVFTPILPTLGIRYGLADGFELGARVANLDSLAADLKVRLLKSTIDLAVDPGLQFYYLPVSSTSDASNQTVSENAAVFYFHLPVLLGVNLSENVSIVLSPGVTYAVASTTVNAGNNVQQAAGSTGLMAGGGLGLDWRLTKKFALHPELTLLKSFGDNDILMYLFGIGFNFGAQPDYSDMASHGAAAPAEKAGSRGGS